MYKKTISYDDFNGEHRVEDFYFNFTESELIETEYSRQGGLTNWLINIIKSRDEVSLMRAFRALILKAYGKKSDDGRRFIKSEELSEEFAQTNAYSVLLMELISDDKAASEFVNGIMPSGIDTSNALSEAKKDPALAAVVESLEEIDKDAEKNA